MRKQSHESRFVEIVPFTKSYVQSTMAVDSETDCVKPLELFIVLST